MIQQYVSPEELRKLLSTLLIVVGAICLFALFAFIVVPGLRNANRPKAGPAVSPPQGETGWLDLTEYPPAKGYDVPPVDPKLLLAPSPDNLARGKALYAGNCAACHGDAGRGDGPGGKGLRPPPRDFTQPDGWKNGPTLPDIYQTLSAGIQGTSMAAFDTLSAKDRMAVAHYVQSLGSFPHGDDPQALEKFGQAFASKGEHVPARIPVSAAMEKLSGEDVAPPAVPRPVTPQTLEGELLRRAVSDPARAGRTLAGTPGWRDDLAAFCRAVTAAPGTNGFSVTAATLSPEELEALQGVLARALPNTEIVAAKRPWHREPGAER
jgi:mono/diheme cytochrome c family protein